MQPAVSGCTEADALKIVLSDPPQGYQYCIQPAPSNLQPTNSKQMSIQASKSSAVYIRITRCKGLLLSQLGVQT